MMAVKPRAILKAPSGAPMRVIRPEHPRLALALATVSVAHNDPSLFARIPEEAGTYTFVGWLAEGTDGVLVDEHGRPIGRLEPGDSLVSE